MKDDARLFYYTLIYSLQIWALFIYYYIEQANDQQNLTEERQLNPARIPLEFTRQPQIKQNSAEIIRQPIK